MSSSLLRPPLLFGAAVFFAFWGTAAAEYPLADDFDCIPVGHIPQLRESAPARACGARFSAPMPNRALRPRLLSIIIDDLGDRADWGRRAVALPGAVTVSILPGTPHATHLARQAHAQGKEVMAHLPMEPVEPHPLGPGALTLHMTEQAFVDTVRTNVASIPHVRGVNNHMGSLLTRHPGHMGWLMAALVDHGSLYFVDSRTTTESVALEIASEHELPQAGRDLFLDAVRDPGAIQQQWDRLIALSLRRRTTLAIGHPYPETLALLERELPRLRAYGVSLVPVSTLLADRASRSPSLWQASLSLSPKAAKNSKP